MKEKRQAHEDRGQKKPFEYVNRKGETYFIHAGITKTGKPRYSCSRSPEGALLSIPEGYEVGESINAVVSIQRPKPALIPIADVEFVRTKLESMRHLKGYKVEAKSTSIIVYEPFGHEVIDVKEKLSMFSKEEGLRPFAERRGMDGSTVMERTASEMGLPIREARKIDKAAAAEQQKRAEEFAARNIRYSPVMRFVLDRVMSGYVAERRYYSGEGGWHELSHGPITELATRYIKHIGKDSYFELM